LTSATSCPRQATALKIDVPSLVISPSTVTNPPWSRTAELIVTTTLSPPLICARTGVGVVDDVAPPPAGS